MSLAFGFVGGAKSFYRQNHPPANHLSWRFNNILNKTFPSFSLPNIEKVSWFKKKKKLQKTTPINIVLPTSFTLSENVVTQSIRSFRPFARLLQRLKSFQEIFNIPLRVFGDLRDDQESLEPFR